LQLQALSSFHCIINANEGYRLRSDVLKVPAGDIAKLYVAFYAA